MTMVMPGANTMLRLRPNMVPAGAAHQQRISSYGNPLNGRSELPGYAPGRNRILYDPAFASRFGSDAVQNAQNAEQQSLAQRQVGNNQQADMLQLNRGDAELEGRARNASSPAELARIQQEAANRAAAHRQANPGPGVSTRGTTGSGTELVNPPQAPRSIPEAPPVFRAPVTSSAGGGPTMDARMQEARARNGTTAPPVLNAPVERPPVLNAPVERPPVLNAPVAPPAAPPVLRAPVSGVGGGPTFEARMAEARARNGTTGTAPRPPSAPPTPGGPILTRSDPRWDPRWDSPGTMGGSGPATTPSAPAGPPVWTPEELERPATPYPGAPGGGPRQSGQPTVPSVPGRTTGGASGGGYSGGGYGGLPGMGVGHSGGTSTVGGGLGGVGTGGYGGQSPYPQQNGNYGGTDPNRPGASATTGSTGGYGWGPDSVGTPGVTRGGGGSSGGSSGGLAGDFQGSYDEAVAENEARYRDILNGYLNRTGTTLGDIDAGNRDVDGGYQSRYNRNLADLGNSQGQISGGYNARFDRNMDRLSNLGAQEAEDINERFDNNAQAQRQSLVGRGLSNSTVLDTMAAGNERERGAELRRHNEGLRREQIGLDTQLSGDALGYGERATNSRIGFDSALSGDAMNFRERANNNRNTSNAMLTGDMLQFMERRDDLYPNYQMLQQLAQGMGQAGGGGGGGMAGVPIYQSPQSMGFQIPNAAWGGMPLGGGFPMGGMPMGGAGGGMGGGGMPGGGMPGGYNAPLGASGGAMPAQQGNLNIQNMSDYNNYVRRQQELADRELAEQRRRDAAFVAAYNGTGGPSPYTMFPGSMGYGQ